MSSQAHDLYRSLLRPAIIHTLRAQGFHSTRPSVLDALTNIAERYLLLLASTTARHALNSHNDPTPTISDVRMALVECGALIPLTHACEEEWKEILRKPVMSGAGDRQKRVGEKRKRDAEDVADITEFTSWFDGPQHAEIRRVAGIAPDPATVGVVGVGGSVVHGEDFLALLKKRYAKAAVGGASVEEGRLMGSVLGKSSEEKEVLIDGGPVQRIRDWKPPAIVADEDGAARGVKRKRDGNDVKDEGYETAAKTDLSQDADGEGDESEDERPLREVASGTGQT